MPVKEITAQALHGGGNNDIFQKVKMIYADHNYTLSDAASSYLQSLIDKGYRRVGISYLNTSKKRLSAYYKYRSKRSTQIYKARKRALHSGNPLIKRYVSSRPLVQQRFEKNLSILTLTVISRKESSGNAEIKMIDIENALKSLCPIWPFC